MKKIMIIIATIILIISSSFIGYLVVSAKIKIKIEDSIIDNQNEIQKDFKSYGYTFENPNIIINPYEISPLTALIIFETTEEKEVKVTIKGKTEDTNISNVFEKSTEHYIPIYGLYPDYENKILLEIGKEKKEITIKTEKLPKNLSKIEKNNTEELLFITTDSIPYAIDKNNEIRWYLTNNYQGNIDLTDNGNLLLSTNKLTEEGIYTGLIEIDFLGKIHKEYQIDTGYYGNYKFENGNILLQSDKIIKLNSKTGTIIENKNDTLTLDKEQNKINLKFYNNNLNYKIIEGHYFKTKTRTKTVQKNIILINYKNIDENYKEYNIKLTQENDRLKVSGNFNSEDEVYIVLNKFLDKKIYELTNKETGIKYINNVGLSGKYSIYIKINNNLYKTNKYIIF